MKEQPPRDRSTMQLKEEEQLDVPHTQNQQQSGHNPLIGFGQDHAFILIKDSKDEREHQILLKFMHLMSSSLPNMHINEIYNCLFSPKYQNLMLFCKSTLIGGISFKCIPDAFAEIKLMSITDRHRTKGKGTVLMALFKSLLQIRKIDLIVTHADNSSKGFYEKQGFTRTEYIQNRLWAPKEQHYYFTTKMQCLVNPEVNYLTLKTKLAKQRQFIISYFRSSYCDHKMYSLTVSPNTFKPYCRQQNEQNEYFIINPASIQGLTSNGWTWSQYQQLAATNQTQDYRTYQGHFPLLFKLAEPQLQKIDPSVRKNSIINYKEPIDLFTLAENIQKKKYEDCGAFWLDFEEFLVNANYFYQDNERIVNSLEKLKEKMEKIRTVKKKKK